MPIENRNLQVGTKLIGKYHKQEYKATVVAGEGDKVRYRLEDGREFKSPSAAGMAITGHACDGWVFWSVQTEVTAPAAIQPETASQPPAGTLANAPEAAAVTPAPATEHAPVASPIYRQPNQKGVPEGQTRWYCRTCAKGFLAPASETPKTCPEGHKAA
jgi:hypothetical protein